MAQLFWILLGVLLSLKTAAAHTNSSLFNNELYDSGYIHVGATVGEMFYWYFPWRHGVETQAPVVLWLTGGPGCSSELATLTENGPFWLGDDVKLTKNEHSWNEIANVIYVDQPLGTGFSIALDPRNFVTNERKVAEHMIEFLQKFLLQYPQLRNLPFYITGESYAGHYVPSIAQAIVKRGGIEGLDLRGIAVGNGWIDPLIQYPQNVEFAYTNGLINEAEYRLAQSTTGLCTSLIQRGNWPLAFVLCSALSDKLIGKKNVYNIDLDCEIPGLCYNFTKVSVFLNKPMVKHALGVRRDWEECRKLVYILMLGDWITQTRTAIGELLSADKEVLLYHGDRDFVCNWFGGLAVANAVNYTRADEFKTLQLRPWMVDGTPRGEIKSSGRFTFLRVFNAGHMVPMDQPAVGLALLKQFIQRGSVAREDEKQKVSWRLENAKLQLWTM